MSDQSILTEIRERLVRVETKIDNMTETQKTARRAEKTANDAYTSAKNAHRRLDKIDKIVFWVATSVIGVIIVAVLNLLFTGGN